MISEEEFFEGFPESRQIYDHLMVLVKSIGMVSVRVTKSQIALCRTRLFAWVWIPEKHLHRKAAPLVLSLSFRQQDPSPRWKQIVEPVHGKFMHHLEIFFPGEIDEQVLMWIQSA